MAAVQGLEPQDAFWGPMLRDTVHDRRSLDLVELLRLLPYFPEPATEEEARTLRELAGLFATVVPLEIMGEGVIIDGVEARPFRSPRWSGPVSVTMSYEGGQIGRQSNLRIEFHGADGSPAVGTGALVELLGARFTDGTTSGHLPETYGRRDVVIIPEQNLMLARVTRGGISGQVTAHVASHS